MDILITVAPIIGLALLAAGWALVQRVAAGVDADDPCGPCDRPCHRIERSPVDFPEA